MDEPMRRRLLAAIAAGLLGLLALVGVRAWQIGAPAMGWVAPRIDHVPPTLPDDLDSAPLAILLFSKTSGFRHEEAIPAMTARVEAIAAARGWAVFATENAAVFRPDLLARFDVIVGNNTTGDNWTDAQKAAFVDWIESGGGFVGVHGAAGTRYRYWDWYTDTLLGGARFSGHPMRPQFREAQVRIEDPTHPTVSHFGSGFRHTDEWYSFEASPREADSHVLATLDEESYAPPEELRMGHDHPVVWIACPRRGRSFYSALGHRATTYADPDQARMIEQAIAWAADRDGPCP